MPDRAPTYSRLGVLDIGSNSVRFVIYEIFGAAFTSIYNEKVLAGLGRDLHRTGQLSVTGKQEAFQSIVRFQTIAKAQKLDRILVGATAALRVASDAQEFIDEIKATTGMDISPVSGSEEARLTALGLIAAEPRAEGLAADLGGASLELIAVKNGKPEPGISLPIGPFQMAGHQLAENDETIKSRILEHIQNTDLSTVKEQPLYLIGGAWRNLAGIHQTRHLYPMRTLQAYTLMPGAAGDLARWAYGSGREDALNWPDVSKRRAETLPFSGLMLDALLTELNPPKIIISTTGLREGLVYDSLPEQQKRRDSLLDGCQDLARGNRQGRNFSKPLLEFLEPINVHLPHVFSAENEARLRRAACQLVGIGKGLHPDYRATIVFGDVLYAPLAGLTHKERAYLALILFHSYTSGNGTPNPNAINLLLSMQERQAARAYGTAIRLGIVASGRTPELLKAFALNFENGTLKLRVDKTYAALATERVSYRLKKFANILGKNIEINEIIIEKQ